PEPLHPHALAAALPERHLERIGNPRRCQGQPLHRRLAGDLAELLAHHRQVLQPVTVGVDNGMLQLGMELSSCHWCPHFLRGSSAGFTKVMSVGPVPATCTIVAWLPAHAKCRCVAGTWAKPPMGISLPEP